MRKHRRASPQPGPAARARIRLRRWTAGVVAAALTIGGLAALSAPAPAEAAGTATLSLYKAIENLATGASEGDRTKWNVQAVNTATGATITADGLNGFQTRVVASGTYQISEQPTPRTPPGYRFRDWNCNGTVYTSPTPTITLTDNQNLTCTVTNVAVQSTLTLVKVVQGSAAPPSLWTLTAQGPSYISGPGGSPQVTNQPVRVNAGAYNLSESGGPATGYVASGWSCTAVDHLGNASPVNLVGTQLTPVLDQAITCRITNTALATEAYLTLVKSVAATTPASHPASAFTLTATPPAGPAISGTTGSAQVTHVVATPDVAYTLSESGPPGYAGSGWTCVANAGTINGTDASHVNLAAGADVTCTITNTFTGGWLTLVKRVVDSRESPGDWTLAATGSGTAAGTAVSGVSGSAQVTEVPVPVGDYALEESGPADGFATDGYVCTGSATPTVSVHVGAGDDVTCEITNTWIGSATQLTLVKQLDNFGGGTMTPGQWSVRATRPGAPAISGRSGTTTVTNVTLPLAPPYTYSLSESSASPAAANYRFVSWTCVDGNGDAVAVTDVDPSARTANVTVPPGSQTTCTVLNKWTQSTISFTKQVINAPFGSHTAGEWTLAIEPEAGGAPIYIGAGDGAIAQEPIAPGTYRLVEVSGPSGYDGPFFACFGDGDADSDPNDDLVTIPESSVVMCTATNRAIAPTVTLVKDLDNAGGGTATVADFTLKARGPGDAAISAPSGDPSVTGVTLPPGQYVFSEDGPPGYDVRWDCVGASAWDPGTEVATLDVGDDMVCTAYNTVDRPTLTLVKSVAGGPATATDWVLTADGPGAPISGVTGDPAVTGAAVDAGTYDLGEAPAAGSGDVTLGYPPGAWSCTAGTLVGSALTLAPGDAATCTVTNTWAGGTLTLVKQVADGGLMPTDPGVPGDWTLHAVGAVTVEGPGGSTGIVAQAVPAGTYALSETLTGGPGSVDADYSPGDWTCSGTGGAYTADSPGVGTVTLSSGADVTCTLVNLFQPPHLTLQKVVEGGPLGTTGDWTLSFTGGPSGTGVTGDAAITGVAVGSGSYALSEAPTDPTASTTGYAPGAWSCDGGALDDHGDGTADLALATDDLDVVCTVTNVWNGAHLALVKQVENGSEAPGTPNVAGDWTLHADGPDGFDAAGSGDAWVGPGEYGLSETTTAGSTIDPGYRPGDWRCTTAAGTSFAPGATGSGTGTLTIDAGADADVTCTLSNYFRPPHLTLVKQVVGGGPMPGAADWPLAYDNGSGTAGSGVTGSPDVTDVGVGGGAFTISETVQPGYEAGDWTCTGAASAPVQGASGSATIALAPDDLDVTCTITNTWTGSVLTLVKQVDDGGGTPSPAGTPASWTLTASGPSTVSGAGGSATIVAQPIAAGSYDLSETPTAGPGSVDPDYRPGAWTCTTATGVTLTAGAPGEATLGVASGADADITCTLTNDWLPPHLTLVKVVEGGGTKPTPSDWPLSFDNADNGRAGSGTTGDAAVTDVAVGAGAVTLAETPDADYTAGVWTCTGAANAPIAAGNGTATIELGPDDRDVTCTITNTWAGAQLTLMKQVEDGGLTPAQPGAPSNWTLTATGPDTLQVAGGGSGLVSSGDYALSEAANTTVDPDYAAGEWTCTGTGGTLTPGPPGSGSVHLDAGAVVTCTIANLYDPPHLTLRKVVHGGPLASTSDWTLAYERAADGAAGSGRTGDASITGVAVGPGAFTLSEQPTDASMSTTGYTTTGWTCDGMNAAGPTVDGAATVELDPDDLEVTCTIENDWTGGTLTLVKTVDDGPAAPSDWTLSADGPSAGVTGTSGQAAVTSVPVLAGTYALAETPNATGAPLDEYRAGPWLCTGGFLIGDSVTVMRDADVTCRITNTFDPPLLTLAKVVRGGPASTGSWMLAADGPTSISGVSGDPLVTAAAVEPGGYTLSESAIPGQPTGGYVSDGWVCTGGTLRGASLTLALGDDATCAVTNRDPGAFGPPSSMPVTGTDAGRGAGFALGLFALGGALGLVALLRRRRGRG